MKRQACANATASGNSYSADFIFAKLGQNTCYARANLSGSVRRETETLPTVAVGVVPRNPIFPTGFHGLPRLSHGIQKHNVMFWKKRVATGTPQVLSPFPRGPQIPPAKAFEQCRVRLRRKILLGAFPKATQHDANLQVCESLGIGLV